ncbi:hypothetical protein CCR94_09055 [Rhodoblastus sphagnicola]|uniref:DUF2125 domain-containing protein n=1 Tax=Rhodoblastus sphagnicola TaxID=333368 RepID=A0A2S6NA04_9HYPH|nr:DUF2125 domain-containing protein [Rhodoblastus sphagnicola]MBB4198813.1 hypothetical protein [Rhodoblastus sphagnicola]PPQ31439.1 hypothetical protein CCR94_09055 [Rhodoblastus sphagnicola]
MAAVSSSSLSRIVLGVVTALALGLSLSWLVAAQKLGDYLHQPAFNGVAFADFCGGSEIGGFPFRLKLTCSQMKAPLKLGGGDLVFTADEVKGVASLWSPNHVVLSFSSPVALRNAGGGFAKLRHDGATFDFAWGFGGLTEVAVNARALDWRPEVIDAGLAFNAQTLNFVARPSSRDGVASLRVEADVTGLTAPLLQSLLRDPGPNALTVSGDLFPLLAPRNDWRQALEDWRRAQGAARIDKAEWRWGALTARFDGVLALDDAHRLAGTLNIDARGAGPLAARLGLPMAPGAANALLGALLGGKPSARDRDKPGDDSIALTLRLAQGGAYLGPLHVGVLTPLY